ncbi:hypothetical protein [Rhodanobacter sp. MP7CTX1]|uniref:hypothetical protein n=1 Tax=Rhodanobacter sp. MP7CTX1 TaxID=2723084 RepID=UPI00161D7EA1|nr:hypothetical protein [Rhodanobacter sp. MP7CTX1]MBB6187622.1 hypothetical protein [Rhodanobacter sp. MP7CTX1]
MKDSENMLKRRDRLVGGLWGLLIGSAFGEVRATWLKDPPATGSIRDRLPGASWGLEGAQILCLLMGLQKKDVPFEAMAGHAIQSARLGICYPDSEYRFAELEGPLSSPTLLGQSYAALECYRQHAIEQCALLFSLPLLWNGSEDPSVLAHQGLILGREAMRDDIDKATLVMGCMLAKAYLDDQADAWEYAANNLLRLSANIGIACADVGTVIGTPPGDTAHAQTHRMLYLLAHVRQALQITRTFERAIDFATAPSPDLRIPMALVGMMAGLHYGESLIPSDRLASLRGRELAKQCIAACPITQLR